MTTLNKLTNHLLLIAIDEYQDENVNNLSNCVSDAIQLRDILLQKYYFHQNDTIEIFNEEATSDAFHKVFEKYISDLTEKDNLIIFYSGHGHYNQTIDRGYWIPTNAKQEQPSTYFSNPDLLDYIRKIKAHHIVLISDSCFSRSILTDYEPSKTHKNLNSLYNSKSRWALTAGQYLAYERNGFSETIISVLRNAVKDILISELIQEVKRALLRNGGSVSSGIFKRLSEHSLQKKNKLLKGHLYVIIIIMQASSFF
jgi:hypothetical protein